MVELRLDPLESTGMPADCYVSVRVGETQKLSKLSASRLYRFPQAGERRYGKIEVFKRIGFCSIDVDASTAGQREVNISCEEAGFGTLGLKVAVSQDAAEQEREKAKEKKPGNGKVKAAKEYLAKHSLEVRLSDAMQAVLRERPDDPAEFMAQKLLGASSAAGSSVRLPPVVRSMQEPPAPPMPASRLPAQDILSPVPPNSKPQSRPPARPHKLEPLQKEVPDVEAPAPQKAVGPPPTKSVGEWRAFYVENFRFDQGPALGRLYSKFRRAAPTGMGKAPAGAGSAPAAAAARAVAFRHKPSVGTWVQAAPSMRPAAAPEPPTGLSARLMKTPSVATWVRPLGPRARKALMAAAAAPAAATPPAAAVSALTAAPVSKAGAFACRPSVGTWLARPCPPSLVEAPKVPYNKKPSVGTWLTRLPEPEEASATAVKVTQSAAAVAPAFTGGGAPLAVASADAFGAMLLPPQIRCGPAFPSLGVGMGMMTFI